MSCKHISMRAIGGSPLLWRTGSFALLAVLAASAAEAGIVHRYSFTSDASDSLGGAHGTVVDSGTVPNHTFRDGMLDLSGNTGETSDNIVENACLDLPNGIVSAAVRSGTNGAVSFEFWATISQIRTWQRFGDFGTGNNGEDTSDSGNASDYIFITPNSGLFNDGRHITNHPASNASEPGVGQSGPFPTGVETQVVAVYDHNDTSAGANGTMTLYRDGQLIGTNQLHLDFSLRTLDDNHNWLGRSQWQDPLFDGSYNEFRIYDAALSAYPKSPSPVLRGGVRGGVFNVLG